MQICFPILIYDGKNCECALLNANIFRYLKFIYLKKGKKK